MGPVLGTLSFFEKKNPYEGVGCGDLSSSIAPKKKNTLLPLLSNYLTPLNNRVPTGVERLLFDEFL